MAYIPNLSPTQIFFSLSKISTNSRSFISPWLYFSPLSYSCEIPYLVYSCHPGGCILYVKSTTIKAIAGKCCVPYLSQWVANMRLIPRARSKMIQWGKRKSCNLYLCLFLCHALKFTFWMYAMCTTEVLKHGHGHKSLDTSLIKPSLSSALKRL